MSHYLYFKHEAAGLAKRFTMESGQDQRYPVHGLRDWNRLITLLLSALDREQSEQYRDNVRKEISAELAADQTSLQNRLNQDEANRDLPVLILQLLIARLRNHPPLRYQGCPRVFISHRISDHSYALRMAQLAVQNNFACWVDVLDPNLQQLPSRRIPPSLLPLLTACIIEMALINCSHVLACMTPNTRGSLWLPYEYGRITEIPGVSAKAMAWVHPDLDSNDFPEYMLLGRSGFTEADIETWFRQESQFMAIQPCNPAPLDLSAYEPLEKLPEEKTDDDEHIRKIQDWIAAGMPLLESLKVPERIRINKQMPD